MSDRPIHLAEFQICERSSESEPSVTVPVWLTQSSLDALFGLICFCEGFAKSGQGEIEGSFELLMLYRTLRNCIQKAELAKPTS